MAAPVTTAPPQVAPSAKIRNPAGVVLLAFVTLGIYWLVYVFKTAKSIKEESGIGVGGGIALLITIIVGIVTPFLLAANVGELRQRGGLPKKVGGPTGFWLLLPLIGYFIWSAKVQGGLNEYWRSRGRQLTPSPAFAG